MLLSDFDFELPADRIAQTPTPDREAARLLVLDRDRGTVCHRTVADLPELLTPGDLLFIPIGWWHQVRSESFSTMLTYTSFHWPNAGHENYPAG